MNDPAVKHPIDEHPAELPRADLRPAEPQPGDLSRAEPEPPIGPPQPTRGRRFTGLVLLIALFAGAGYAWWHFREQAAPTAKPDTSGRVAGKPFYPTQAQWASMTVEPVQRRVFRTELTTEGKVAIDEDISTPVFSPYAGRVTKLLVRPGEQVKRGQPLLMIEATEAVLAQNDFVAALANVNKARSQLNLARTTERRLRDLSQAKAVALREYQQAQAEVVNAENDLRSTETARESVRNRLRIFSRTDAEIDEFEKTGKMMTETPIFSPIDGTVIQRRIGPGQYVMSGATDPVFVVGDLSRVWIVAYVRESEAQNVRVGQTMYFKILASTELPRGANVSYVATALEPSTRRLLVRAVVANGDAKLKPEMFTTVTIFTGEGDSSPSVPRDAVLYEGETARVWVVLPDNAIELRYIKPGLISDRHLQVLEGLQPGERIIVRGSVFIDREGQGG